MPLAWRRKGTGLSPEFARPGGATQRVIDRGERALEVTRDPRSRSSWILVAGACSQDRRLQADPSGLSQSQRNKLHS